MTRNATVSERRGPPGSTPAPSLTVASLTAWFRANARDLPWRRIDPVTGRRDPYASLVSELMLQQTQVSRVIDKFNAFMARFPTVAALAAADEGDVLAAWAGLGYYRRARWLHAAAKAVVAEHGGMVPRAAAALRDLPGIGPYTAGAVASIVFGQPEPLVDGNVTRVLLRLSARRGRTGDPADTAWAWANARTLVQHADDPGAWNEGLMELGATVCTPARPRCALCPLADACRARAKGWQQSIPLPKLSPDRATVVHACAVVRDRRGRVLLERRPDTGLWPGLWQPPAVDNTASRRSLREHLGLRGLHLRRAGEVRWTLSHLNVTFHVWAGESEHGGERTWSSPTSALAISNAHKAVIRSATPSHMLFENTP